MESDPLCVCGHAQRDHHDRADGCEVTVSQPGSTTYADDCMEFTPAGEWVPPETACSCGRPAKTHTYGSDGCSAAADQDAERSELLDESSLGAPHVKAASDPTLAEVAERFIARQRQARAESDGYVVVFVLPDGAVGTASVPPGVAVRIDDGQLVISARDRRPISITSVKTLKE